MDNFSKAQRNYDNMMPEEENTQNYDSNGYPIGADKEGYCEAITKKNCWRFCPGGRGGCIEKIHGKCTNCFVLMDLGLYTEE